MGQSGLRQLSPIILFINIRKTLPRSAIHHLPAFFKEISFIIIFNIFKALPIQHFSEYIFQ